MSDNKGLNSLCKCGHILKLHDDQAVCRALVRGHKSCQCMQFETDWSRYYGRYRVECTASPSTSPFPCHTWRTRKKAEQFCNSEAAGEWKGKLSVVKYGEIRGRYGKPGTKAIANGGSKSDGT